MNTKVLEKYRLKKGLSITELSALMNRTPGWYSRVKDGKQGLRPQYIEKLASIFGIRSERLARELFAAQELEDHSSSDVAN